MGKLKANQSIQLTENEILTINTIKENLKKDYLFDLIITQNDNINERHLNYENLMYRAEGNANLVLSIPETRQVLRMRKSTKIELSQLNDYVCDQSIDDFKLYIEYSKFVSSIFGDKLACPPEQVSLDIINLNNFNQWLLNYRPGIIFYLFINLINLY